MTNLGGIALMLFIPTYSFPPWVFGVSSSWGPCPYVSTPACACDLREGLGETYSGHMDHCTQKLRWKATQSSPKQMLFIGIIIFNHESGNLHHAAIVAAPILKLWPTYFQASIFACCSAFCIADTNLSHIRNCFFVNKKNGPCICAKVAATEHMSLSILPKYTVAHPFPKRVSLQFLDSDFHICCGFDMLLTLTSHVIGALYHCIHRLSLLPLHQSGGIQRSTWILLTIA